MKTYTTTVALKWGGDPFVFNDPQAYLQAKSGQDIYAEVADDDPYMVFIPRHAIASISFTASESEAAPAEDAFCE